MAAVLEDRESEIANDMDEDGYILERILLNAFPIFKNNVLVRFSIIKSPKLLVFRNIFVLYIVVLVLYCQFILHTMSNIQIWSINSRFV